MDMILVKNITEVVIEPFIYFCNLSFSTGVFLKKMKTAKVIPLYKNGDKHDFTNYRQVSLLSQFFENTKEIICSQLDKFINIYNILSILVCEAPWDKL